jgi:hypothetical protein
MTLIEAVRATLRRLHDSPRAEEAYVHWIRQFLRFHPRQRGAEEQTLLGHKDVRTTMIYSRLVDRGPLGVVSPRTGNRRQPDAAASARRRDHACRTSVASRPRW